MSLVYRTGERRVRPLSGMVLVGAMLLADCRKLHEEAVDMLVEDVDVRSTLDHVVVQ